MSRSCEMCEADGESVEVTMHDGEVQRRSLCLEHQLAEVDLGARAVQPAPRTERHEPTRRAS